MWTSNSEIKFSQIKQHVSFQFLNQFHFNNINSTIIYARYSGCVDQIRRKARIHVSSPLPFFPPLHLPASCSITQLSSFVISDPSFSVCEPLPFIISYPTVWLLVQAQEMTSWATRCHILSPPLKTEHSLRVPTLLQILKSAITPSKTKYRIVKSDPLSKLWRRLCIPQHSSTSPCIFLSPFSF